MTTPAYRTDLPDFHTLDVHQYAAATLEDMNIQAAGIENVWRHLEPERASKALTSLVYNLSYLFSKFFGSKAIITRDGELSLFISHKDTTFVYGMVFHADFYRDVGPTEGHEWPRVWNPVPRESVVCLFRDAEHNSCAQPYKYGSDYKVALPTCEGHEPDPFLVPTPGTWSFHS